MNNKIDNMHDFCSCGKIKYKYAKLCWDCYLNNCSGKDCFHYKDGRSLKTYYCKVCKIKIRYRSIYCQSCAAKVRFKESKNHPSWKGGKQKRYRPRNTDEYYNWRKTVFEKDSYTCQCCSILGGKLEAHHLKCWKLYPKERFKLSNGKTLCIKCHKRYHSKFGLNVNHNQLYNL
jgi:hypothetical protein